MKLKPFRDYSEHDVRNLFAFSGASATQGTAVSPTVGVIPTALPFVITRNLGSAISNRVYSPIYETVAKVGLTASGSKPYGLALYDVAETDGYGVPLRYDPLRKAELQVVCSGETLPILRKGMLTVSGFAGTPGVGSGVSVGANGQLAVNTSSGVGVFGTFLGGVDTEGYAVIDFDCY